MKAIETQYRGYKFRSRLEARWAVFFDRIGVAWEYEPEGYDLDALGWYLPDFLLPDINPLGLLRGTWVEVKRPGLDTEDRKIAEDKLRAVCRLTQASAILVDGDPMRGVEFAKEERTDVGWPLMGAEFWDSPYLFCTCPWCGKIGIEFDGRGARVCGWREHFPSEEIAMDASIRWTHRVDDKCYTGHHERIASAAKAARSERFNRAAYT